MACRYPKTDLADLFRREHIGNPQAVSELPGTLKAGSFLDRTRSINGQIAHGTLLFAMTLVASRVGHGP